MKALVRENRCFTLFNIYLFGVNTPEKYICYTKLVLIYVTKVEFGVLCKSVVH